MSNIFGKPEVSYIEIPVFKLNFYLMGMDEVDEAVTLQIGKNVDYLNQEFEGKIKFVLNKLVMDSNHEFIPDLHHDHLRQNRRQIEALLEPVEIEGSVNIYLFETYAEDNSDVAMMGFTPILSQQYDQYQPTSPQFDRLFISYTGLENRTTIVHEMGHFLGLSHPWEMHRIDRSLMGLDNSRSEKNHMTYHPEVNHFNEQQLERMQHFALTFRTYLLSHIEVQEVRNEHNFSLSNVSYPSHYYKEQ